MQLATWPDYPGKLGAWLQGRQGLDGPRGLCSDWAGAHRKQGCGLRPGFTLGIREMCWGVDWPKARKRLSFRSGGRVRCLGWAGKHHQQPSRAPPFLKSLWCVQCPPPRHLSLFSRMLPYPQSSSWGQPEGKGKSCGDGQVEFEAPERPRDWGRLGLEAGGVGWAGGESPRDGLGQEAPKKASHTSHPIRTHRSAPF